MPPYLARAWALGRRLTNTSEPRRRSRARPGAGLVRSAAGARVRRTVVTPTPAPTRPTLLRRRRSRAGAARRTAVVGRSPPRALLAAPPTGSAVRRPRFPHQDGAHAAAPRDTAAPRSPIPPHPPPFPHHSKRTTVLLFRKRSMMTRPHKSGGFPYDPVPGFFFFFCSPATPLFSRNGWSCVTHSQGAAPAVGEGSPLLGSSIQTETTLGLRR